MSRAASCAILAKQLDDTVERQPPFAARINAGCVVVLKNRYDSGASFLVPTVHETARCLDGACSGEHGRSSRSLIEDQPRSEEKSQRRI
jgi:hypothetical protein